MCGIVGWIADITTAPPSGTIHAMLDAVVHRGPDDHGTYYFRSRHSPHEISLGHRRLAIIDPNGARQPMCDAAAGIALVFNGEIYNFRELRDRLRRLGYSFALDSDTEVLLRAYQHWGTDVVQELRGMFAFALSDSRRGIVLFARDRFGEKPLYLCQQGRNLYFASEIKALLRVPEMRSQVNLEAVWEYLNYRYVPGPDTLFRGIYKLAPATMAIWEQGKLTHTRYWNSPDRNALTTTPVPADPVAAFLERLDEAVRLQMVSDVPFGAFLSGGLDSSTIVALMSRHNPRVMTFSVGFREARYSELPYAAEVARHCGAHHHELLVTEADIMTRLAPMVAMRDAPVSEPSDIAIHMLAREAARSVKMVLSGEGSDELLGGYPKHVAERFATGYQQIPAPLRGLVSPLVHALPYGFRRIKTAVATLGVEDWAERQVRWFGTMSRDERAALATSSVTSVPPVGMPPFDSDPAASALRRTLYFDQTSWLPDNLLERADRMTMAASLESRVPFLDHELAAFVSTLPDHYRVRGWRGKWLLRTAARTLLPKKILTRRKVGFRVPVNEWFRGALRDFLRDHLQTPESRTRAYFDTKRLDTLVAEHIEGRQNHEKLLWSLLNLEIWHRQYA